MSNVLAPEIQAALKQMDARKSELIDMQPSVEVARELCAHNGWPTFRLDPMPSAGWPPIVIVAMTRSMKDMAPHLKFLADNNHRQTKNARDIPELSARLWFCGNIGLLVMIGGPSSPDAGPTCRYVEIGKKEVPIYELQCDDGAKPQGPVLPALSDTP